MFKSHPLFRTFPTTTATLKFFKRSLSEFYNLSAKDIKGNLLKFDQLKGKTVLIVNVASQCGFTKQYEGLKSYIRNTKVKGLPF